MQIDVSQLRTRVKIEVKRLFLICIWNKIIRNSYVDVALHSFQWHICFNQAIQKPWKCIQRSNQHVQQCHTSKRCRRSQWLANNCARGKRQKFDNRRCDCPEEYTQSVQILLLRQCSHFQFSLFWNGRKNHRYLKLVKVKWNGSLLLCILLMNRSSHARILICFAPASVS